MDLFTLVSALLLGVVEGLTEFLPVSSTGHLILFGDLLGFEGPPGHVFEIVIQLGAILAVCWAYRRRFLDTVAGLFRQPRATRFALNLVVAFLPAAAIGAVAHGFIKSVLFSPAVVAAALVVGGLAILWIERVVGEGRVADVDDFSYGLAFKIGLCQVISMIPGVSRAGATIMGAMLLGVERRAATEFSFFLAVPTMLGATAYDVYKNWSHLTSDGWGVIGLGFVVAFISALAVVRTLIGFVGRHGFAPFAWYRIVAGAAMALILAIR
jgi:undecaprenyl-diphosphatase